MLECHLHHRACAALCLYHLDGHREAVLALSLGQGCVTEQAKCLFVRGKGWQPALTTEIVLLLLGL